jgi:DNA-binding transcriptional LysR family regulator
VWPTTSWHPAWCACARYPRLRVELDSSIAYSDLTRREADIALRTSRPESGDLLARKLVEPRDVLLGSEAYVRELGTLTAFSQTRFVTWGHDLAHLPSTRWVVEHVPASAIVLRSSSIHALLGAAESGLGLVLLSGAHAQVRPLARASLSVKLQKQVERVPPLSLWLVGHRALRDVPRVAAVWDFIVHELLT